MDSINGCCYDSCLGLVEGKLRLDAAVKGGVLYFFPLEGSAS